MFTMCKTIQNISVAVLAMCVFGCAGLVPKEMMYRVDLEPMIPEGRGDYYFDYDDSSAVFSVEGALIKVKHLTNQKLNTMYPPLWDGRHINPYTSDTEDSDKGYIAPIFTVFEVTVANKTYAKIELDPANVVLITDDGQRFTFYDASRESSSENNFREYYKVELGISGNEKQLALERMGLVYKTAYHQDRPVFRGDAHSGFISFPPLPEGANEMIMKIEDFVLSFDASGNPERTTDCEFRFKIEQGAVPVTGPEEGT